MTNTPVMQELQDVPMHTYDATALMQEGVIVTLTIGRWRAETTLSFDDLGLQIEDEEARKAVIRMMQLGKKRLLPPELLSELAAAESAARRTLEKRSFDTPWGRFVPVTAYLQWKEENEKTLLRYMGLRDRLVREYDAIVQSIVSEYCAAARHAYWTLLATRPEIVRGQTVEDYVELFVENVLRHIPTAERIATTFRYEIVLSRIAITLPEQQNQASEPASVMQRDLMAYLHERKERDIDAFMTGIVVQLRTLINEVMSDVLTNIGEQGSMPRNSTRQLKNLIDQVSALNFYGDVEVDAMLERIKAIVETPADLRDIPSVERNFAAIQTLTRAAMSELTERRRSRMVGDGGVGVPVEEIQRSRRMLGLDETGVPAIAVVRQGRFVE